MPHSRPMPAIGRWCHEFRIGDEAVTWRIIYRADNDTVVIAEAFKKKTAQTPKPVIEAAKRRLKDYDNA